MIFFDLKLGLVLYSCIYGKYEVFRNFLNKMIKDHKW